MEMRKLELTEARAGMYEQCEEAEQADDGEVADGIAEEPVRRRDGIDSRTKHFGDTLRHGLPAMPSEISELPQFFDTIEKLYQIYQVPDDLKAKLLISCSTAHWTRLPTGLQPDCLHGLRTTLRYVLVHPLSFF